MENLTLEEKLKIRDAMVFKDKLELMKTLCELAFLYKNENRLNMPIVDNAVLPQDVKDFMTSQGFVFYDYFEDENNKLYTFEFIGKVGE